MTVPTASDLARRGLARVLTAPKGDSAGVFRVSDEGHAEMGAAMRENALAALARGEGNWTQPPSNGVRLTVEE